MYAGEPAWLQHQRQRWMQPGAARYLRTNATPWMRGDTFQSRQFPGYEQKYRPDQPRVPAGNPDGGQWTTEGGGEVRIAVFDNAVVSDALPDAITPGARYAQYETKVPDPAIERTKDILHNILVRVNGDVSRRRDLLSGALYGIRVHTEFAEAVRERNLPGIGTEGVEQSFDADGLTRYGMD